MEELLHKPSDNFESFYCRHVDAIYRICYAYMKNAHDAEDCTEDTFVRAMTADACFENERHERAWLTTTAMNICRDRLKHWWNKNTVSIEAPFPSASGDKVISIADYLESDAFFGSSSSDKPEDFLESKELLQSILDLPEKYKTVILLYYYSGYSTDEIAQMLKRPPSTIRNQLRDGRKKLKGILGGERL